MTVLYNEKQMEKKVLSPFHLPTVYLLDILLFVAFSTRNGKNYIHIFIFPPQ